MKGTVLITAASQHLLVSVELPGGDQGQGR